MNTRVLFFLALFVCAMPLLGKEELPPVMLKGLSSEDFSIREKSQQSLLEWAREKPGSRAGDLYKLSYHEDPEIRKRSAEILRELSDDDYLTDGQGYLGVMMTEEMLNADPNGKPGIGIRISRVIRGSPADLSGVKAGDLIVALDAKEWHEAGALDVFREVVAGKKPLTNVVLTVRRAAGPIEIAVKLGKRPVPDLQPGTSNLGALDKLAKDEHFRKWLEQQKKARQ